jgi:SAM-dependent methyltransferase
MNLPWVADDSQAISFEMSGSGARPRRPRRHRHRPGPPEGPVFQGVGIEVFCYSGTFDHVVAILSLHHVEDLGSALNKIAGLLRAGGPLVVVEFAGERIRRSDGRMGTGTPPRRLCLGRALVSGAILPREGPRRWPTKGNTPRPRPVSRDGRPLKAYAVPGGCARRTYRPTHADGVGKLPVMTCAPIRGPVVIHANAVSQRRSSM